jgi:ferredoxin
MIRRIINIDEEKCTGCGICADACHEGSIAIIDGKAKLTRDDYCDGLGDCLPTCPTSAISFTEREAADYDEKAVEAHKAEREKAKKQENSVGNSVSYLTNWPVQIKLTAIKAPWFSGADILIAADCTAFSYGNFHEKFMKGNVTLVGCPKLDAIDYAEKLSHIFRENDVKSIHVVRMEVPCCGGMVVAVKKAIENSGKNIDLTVTTVSVDGKILD